MNINKKIMRANPKKNSAMLLVAAFFWGTTYVAQGIAAKGTIGAYTYLFGRSLIACIFLGIMIAFFDRTDYVTRKPETKQDKKTLLCGGIILGFIVMFASFMQQYGMSFTSAGKAGFITSFYIILVPIIGIFLKKKTNLFVKIGIVLSLVALYFLCITEQMTIGWGDLLCLFGAFGYTAQILVINAFSPKVDGIRLSFIQFCVLTILSLIGEIITEGDLLNQLLSYIGPVLYAGIFSSGIAYTLQILGQKNLNPTIAAILMSTESVFGVLASWLVLHESMSMREIIGCIIMFIAIIFSELPESLTEKLPLRSKKAAEA